MIFDPIWLASLQSQLSAVRTKIVRLRRQGIRDFGSRKEANWPETERARMRKLKDAAKSLQERIDNIVGTYAEAAE